MDVTRAFIDDCLKIADETGLGDQIVAELEPGFTEGSDELKLIRFRFLTRFAIGAAFKAGMHNPDITRYVAEHYGHHDTTP